MDINILDSAFSIMSSTTRIGFIGQYLALCSRDMERDIERIFHYGRIFGHLTRLAGRRSVIEILLSTRNTKFPSLKCSSSSSPFPTQRFDDHREGWMGGCSIALRWRLTSRKISVIAYNSISSHQSMYCDL